MKRASLIALAAIVLNAGCSDPSTTPAGTGPKASAVVTEVVDGDTIRVLLDGRTERVRFIGVDAPEVAHPDQPAECFGAESALFVRRVLDGQQVRFELDAERRDRFERLLAYVFHEGELFNRRVVAEGFAVERSYPPNLAHQDELREAEGEARQDRRGLWGACERHD